MERAESQIPSSENREAPTPREVSASESQERKQKKRAVKRILKNWERAANINQRRAVAEKILNLIADDRKKILQGISQKPVKESESLTSLINEINNLEKFLERVEASPEKLAVLKKYFLEWLVSGQVNSLLLDKAFQEVKTVDNEQAKKALGQKFENINPASFVQPIHSETGTRGRLFFSERYFNDINKIDQLRLLGHEMMHVLLSSTFIKPKELDSILGSKEGRELALETYYIRELLNSNLSNEDFLEELLCERFADFSLVAKEILPKKLTFEEWVNQKGLSGSEKETQEDYQKYEEERLTQAALKMFSIRLHSINSEEVGAKNLQNFFGEEVYNEFLKFQNEDLGSNLQNLDVRELISRLPEEKAKFLREEIERNKKLYEIFEEHLSHIKTEDGYQEAVRKYQAERPQEVPTQERLEEEIPQIMDSIPYFDMSQAGTQPVPGFPDRNWQVITSGIAALVAEIIPGTKGGS